MSILNLPMEFMAGLANVEQAEEEQWPGPEFFASQQKHKTHSRDLAKRCCLDGYVKSFYPPTTSTSSRLNLQCSE
jgi:hypothetical protein